MGREIGRFHERQLNLRVRGLGQSATLEINERSAKLIAEGQTIYKLGLGQSPFPVPKVVVDALKDHAHEKDYLPVSGLWELRQDVAHFHQRKDGLSSTGNDVLIGPGSKELIFLLQLVYYGNLIIPKPSWVSYAPQAQIIGRNVCWLQTTQKNGWRLTAAELDQFCRTDPDCPRLIILNYPANPTGCTYGEDDLRELAEVARKYRLLLLSDEIYSQLHFKGKHLSIARFYPEGTIISSGLSKWCGAGGWRLGTFVFPRQLRWLLKGLATVASETFTATSAPIQYAAISAFRGGPEIDAYLFHSRRILKTLGGAVYQTLSDMKLRLPKPQGGFYVFADFEAWKQGLAKRKINTSADLCNHLLADTGVALLPGSVFGRPENELTARLAFVDFDGTGAIEASHAQGSQGPLDDSFLKNHCPRVLKGLNQIKNWLS